MKRLIRIIRKWFHPKTIVSLAEDIENGLVDFQDIRNPYRMCVHFKGMWNGQIVQVSGSYDGDGGMDNAYVYIGDARFDSYDLIMAAWRRNKKRLNNIQQEQISRSVLHGKLPLL